MPKIYIGKANVGNIVSAYLRDNGLKKVAFIGDSVALEAGITVDGTNYAESIMYRNYYRLLQFIGHDTLFVWNNAFVSCNRYLLNYNCIRKYAQQTPHRLVFQDLPIREHSEDFMTLWDMIQPNPFLKEAFADVKRFENVDLSMFSMPEIVVENVEITPEHERKYQKVKEDAIAAVKKNADIIPHRCLKYAETLACKIAGKKFDSKEEIQSKMSVSITKLPVDNWYFERLQKIIGEMRNVIEKVY